MARKSSIESNKNRRCLIEAKKAKRQEIKAQLKNRELGFEERLSLVHKLAEMPRNSSAVRYRNRCLLSGRSRGYYRKFALSRIALRDLASSGMLPGVTKASW
jgi:small subunit ribosomal protein S14